ncbi:MAG: aminodeoxychorismate synthase component I [Rhodospirillales bacterium]
MTPVSTETDDRPCILLHESQPETGGRGRGSRWLTDCEEIITCREPDDIAGSFARIERALEAGLTVAGGFAYELGYFLEPKLEQRAPAFDAPLMQVGAFRGDEIVEPSRAASIVAARCGEMPPAGEAGDVRLEYGETAASYVAKLHRALDYIHAGDIYQVNFTFPACFDWPDGVWPLYARLMGQQAVSFGAVVDLPDLKAASLSPELFFRKSGSRIESRPMKGTAARGFDAVEDDAIAAGLRADPKNRAENLMIVDLIRNDLGRLARIGSVRVDELYRVERYQTVHQMVSHVSAEIDPDTSLETIMGHIFPCGSVTGAPKIRAMEIIAELEDRPRGIYTGAIGYITPGRDMAFSVPIRTVQLPASGRAVLGIGSGVVADSSAEGEYAECLLKARFLRRALAPRGEREGGPEVGPNAGPDVGASTA